MYVSNVINVGIIVLCLSGMMLKLSGLAGFVHGTGRGNYSGVKNYCSFGSVQ
jgi:hypothetical protein